MRLLHVSCAIVLVACSRNDAVQTNQAGSSPYSADHAPNRLVKFSAASTQRGTELLFKARRTFAAKASLFTAADTGFDTDGVTIVASPTGPRGADSRVT